nr:CHAD domain-containing protein [Streptomyces sp. SID5468]
MGDHAAEFLRALRLRGEDEQAAIALLRGSARRISAALHTYEALVDPGWAETLRGELRWLSTLLAREHRYGGQLARLTAALHRLADGDAADPAAGRGPVAVGAARAGALLERQLTLARTRAHSATLQAFGSARFHAVADHVALLASELPLVPAAGGPAGPVLLPLAERAHQRLTEAAAALPLSAAGRAYNAHATHGALADPAAADQQDAPWHRVRAQARLCRYALEVVDPLLPGAPEANRLHAAWRALERHREAADAASAAATAARTPRITPATAYALGVLHADQRAEVEAARHAFGRIWQSVAVPFPEAVTAP